jgi:predicted alpha/beta-hydrolase family hydrolase
VIRRLPGESWIRIPRLRGGSTPALWKPGRGAALIFHGTPPASIDGHARELAVAFGSRGWGTLRVLFRPLGWDRPPSRSEVIRRLPAARAAVRWAKGERLLLAGSSMGAVLAARVAAASGAERLVLVSPPFRNKRLGDSFRRWLPALEGFRGSRLVVVGDRDAAWAPLDLVRSLIPPEDLVVLQGADHGLGGFEAKLRAAVRR